ncbi:MAG: cyclophilin-like fold protein [Desulfosudaceae bacterium]
MTKIIKLDFGGFSLPAELFDTSPARAFAAHLPYTVALTQWGGELYGSIGVSLAEETPVADIPAGGLAYTGRGNLFCVFFGQTPAWPVEYIGQIPDEQWPLLIDASPLEQVVISF